ncbi:hypothetical protein GZH47_02250 [Paenibacillus rhizovicinus]|uniref:Uncharacterized protein n=1 Tax=Paenibacillus rhizovicinus TaxID=2704463 RepID=A0A6C0NUA9_9BACL|nr:hypothetical protein [Paenibacillus rhizovicinus]QHW29775.1 hypothetical protein GZH47_02250 [Paenibacillus rhizovicinus]
MNLTSDQQTVLRALTTEWQSPIQVSESLPEGWGDLSSMNQLLKELIGLKLAQTIPVVIGLYRLTADGPLPPKM